MLPVAKLDFCITNQDWLHIEFNGYLNLCKFELCVIITKSNSNQILSIFFRNYLHEHKLIRLSKVLYEYILALEWDAMSFMSAF